MTTFIDPTDRIAPDLEPLLQDIANLSPEKANCVEAGAITVIGLFGESMKDFYADTMRQAEEQGVPSEVAHEAYATVAEAIDALFQPRLDAMREAVRAAQGDPLSALLDALVEGLGDDLAASFDDDPEVKAEQRDPLDEAIEREAERLYAVLTAA